MGPVAACTQVRMVPDTLHVINNGSGNGLFVPPADDFVRYERGEDVADDMLQRFVLQAVVHVGRKADIHCQVGSPEHLLAEY